MTEEVKSSVEKLLHLYKFKNKSSLNRNYVICSKCNSWLTQPIFVVEDGTNICGKCIEQFEGNSIRNISLENLLHGTKYPCKYNDNGCNVFNSYNDMERHEAVCNYKSVKCFCNIVLNGKKELLEHILAEHEMETITMTRPFANITVNLQETLKIQPFKLEIGKMLLIVVVSYDLPAHTMKLMVWNGTNLQKNLKYFVKMIYDGTEHGKYGTVFDNSFDIDSSCQINLYALNKSQELIIKLYFENYKKIKPFYDYLCLEQQSLKDMDGLLRSCLRCHVQLTSQTNEQVRTGHYYCISCSNSKDKRDYINLIGKMSMYVLNNHLRACQYAKSGCFKYGKNDEMKSHQTICSMRSLNCKVWFCEREIALDKYIEHLLNEHELQLLHETPAIITPGLLSYNGVVIEFKFKSAINEGITECKWSLQLIHLSDNTISSDYTLNISISGKIITIHGGAQTNTKTNIIHLDGILEEAPVFTLTM